MLLASKRLGFSEIDGNRENSGSQAGLEEFSMTLFWHSSEAAPDRLCATADHLRQAIDGTPALQTVQTAKGCLIDRLTVCLDSREPLRSQTPRFHLRMRPTLHAGRERFVHPNRRQRARYLEAL